MACLNALPKNGLIKDLPTADKVKLALEWLCMYSTESPTTTIYCYSIKNKQSLQQT